MSSRTPEGDSAWDYYQHADNLLHQRHNIFIVAQSIFFAAFSQGATQNPDVVLQRVIAGAGFVYAGCWWWLSNRLRERMTALDKPYLRADSVYCLYAEVLDKSWPKKNISAAFVLNTLLPGLTGLAWLFLLCRSN